jgi:hypothetical protein
MVMPGEKFVGKDVERNSCGIISRIILEFV